MCGSGDTERGARGEVSASQVLTAKIIFMYNNKEYTGKVIKHSG
ncbi:hypothetical protein ALC62_03415 [Cyphomyrmex costatus]|uniref:Uncharacterized protein n=1 Tax=Cyphomyrmex costatus TaxID=456900 RepID=A0A195CYG3_9HYME|nr:hypothetical protein ALC62_03415 [Cyphomyrmex costatus]